MRKIVEAASVDKYGTHIKQPLKSKMYKKMKSFTCSDKVKGEDKRRKRMTGLLKGKGEMMLSFNNQSFFQLREFELARGRLNPMSMKKRNRKFLEKKVF